LSNLPEASIYVFTTSSIVFSTAVYQCIFSWQVT